MFKNWLEEVVKLLQGVDNTKHKFVSSVCVACCTMDCHVSQLKQEEFVYPLLEMLHIQPNLESQSCPNVSYLFEVIDQDSRYFTKTWCGSFLIVAIDGLLVLLHYRSL